MNKKTIRIFELTNGAAFWGLGKDDFILTFSGLALLLVPVIMFFYGEFVYCKIIERRHCFRMRKTSEESGISGISPSEAEKPSSFIESEANKFRDNPGNFLLLAYGIDNQLRLAASEITKRQFPENFNKDEIYKIIAQAGIFTKCGKKKISFINWLRDAVQTGRTQYLSDKTVRLGICLAWELHQEMNVWLRKKAEEIGSGRSEIKAGQKFLN